MNTAYIVCFLLGVSLSAVTFFLGTHDLHFSHFHFHVGGHHHHAHVPQKGSLAEHTAWLNFGAVTAFLTWFGCAGIVLGQAMHWNALPVAGASLAAGIVGGSVVNRFLRALSRRERPLAATTVVGVLALVTSTIREGGTGEIVFTQNGTRKVSGARSDNGQAMAKGAEVIVTRYEKGIAYVSTWDELEAITPES